MNTRQIMRIFNLPDHCYYMVESRTGKQFKVFFVNNFGQKKFITHRNSIKQATKIAKMLKEAYVTGFSSGIY